MIYYQFFFLSQAETRNSWRETQPKNFKFYKEENKKARRHELQLMQMMMSLQQSTEHVQSSTPVNSQKYGYMAVSPQHAFGCMESRGLHQV